MTKKLFVGSMCVAIFASQSVALTMQERISKLEETIKLQQQELEKLKDNYYEEDIQDLDKRVTDVEVRSYTDKIQLGLGFKTELHHYDNQYADGTGYSTDDIWRTKLQVNMHSQISDTLEFSGRVSMYKNWGDSTSRNTTNDSMQGRKPDNSTLYAERAYIDWTLNPESILPITVTLGRQPSSDGPSHQVKEDTARKGTYSALTFDGAADGIVFTANLDKYIASSYLRFAYGTPNVLDNQANSPTQTNYFGADNGSFENTKVMGVFFDTSFTHLGFNNLLQTYFVKGQDLNANPALDDDTNVGDLSLTGFSIGGG